jgi:hypothetical protein
MNHDTVVFEKINNCDALNCGTTGGVAVLGPRNPVDVTEMHCWCARDV